MHILSPQLLGGLSVLIPHYKTTFSLKIISQQKIELVSSCRIRIISSKTLALIWHAVLALWILKKYLQARIEHFIRNGFQKH